MLKYVIVIGGIFLVAIALLGILVFVMARMRAPKRRTSMAGRRPPIVERRRKAAAPQRNRITVMPDHLVQRAREVHGISGNVNLQHAEPYLNWIVAHGGKVDGRSYHVGSRSVLIGREPDCFIQVPDAEFSRHHCKVTPTEHGLLVEDQGSANGVEYRGSAIRRLEIADGDAFTIGDVTFEFHKIANFQVNHADFKEHTGEWLRMSTVHRHVLEPLSEDPTGDATGDTTIERDDEDPTHRQGQKGDAHIESAEATDEIEREDETLTEELARPESLPALLARQQKTNGVAGGQVSVNLPPMNPEDASDLFAIVEGAQNNIGDSGATIVQAPPSQMGQEEESTDERMATVIDGAAISNADIATLDLVRELDNPERAMSAAMQLVNLGSSYIPDVLRAASRMRPEERSILMTALTARANTIEDALCEGLKSDDPDSVYLAAGPLCAIASMPAAPLLVDILLTPGKVTSPELLAHLMAPYGEKLVDDLLTALTAHEAELAPNHILITLLRTIATTAGPGVYLRVERAVPKAAQLARN